MDNETILELFRETDREIRIDKRRKEDTLAYLHHESAMREIPMAHSKISIIKIQSRYMDKTPVILQMIGCMIVLFCMSIFYRCGWENSDAIVMVMMVSAALSFFFLFGISRMFTSNIAELSDSCYFNAKQLIAFHMICSGLNNLMLLFVMTLFIGAYWKMAWFQAGLYVFVPYIEIQCCCTGMFLTELGRRNPYVAFAAGIFSCMVFLVLASIPEIFLISSITFWGVAFVVGVILYGIQLLILFHRLEEGEIVCMN